MSKVSPRLWSGRGRVLQQVLLGCGLVATAWTLAVWLPSYGSSAPLPVTWQDVLRGRDDVFRRGLSGLESAHFSTETPTRAESHRWFARAKLGLLIAYGPSTLFAAPNDHRWLKEVGSRRIRAAVRDFDPDPAAVADWVRLAKRLGASYITVTAKHHDGFGLWPSRLTGWDVAPADDLIAPLAKACRKAGLRLFVYYSLLDLHESSYADDKHVYMHFVEGQLGELLTRYGPLAGVWFDGSQEIGDRQLEAIYGFVHHLQPWALVATNHHRWPLPGEDFQIFESAFPGQRGPGVIATPISQLKHEVAIKLGPSWFWAGPHTQLHPDRLDSLLRRARSQRANVLIDIPPRPDGRFDLAVWRWAEQNVSRGEREARRVRAGGG
jgi:alpha-L-fucosidase